MTDESNKENELLKYSTRISFYFIVLGILGFLILMAPFILKLDNSQNYGIVGDTVGGILNPVVAIGAGFLTFMAFLIQYEANKQVQKQFKIQQFESQFYEMLRLYKENVSEMKIVGYEPIIERSVEKDVTNTIVSTTETITVGNRLTEGRKVFVTMSTEFIACYELLKLYNSAWNLNFTPNIILKLAYDFFFFGADSDIVGLKLIESEITENFRIELNKIRKLHKNSSGVKNRIAGIDGEVIKIYIKYYPFSGHENRLGHYYRHLYATVKYVVQNEKKGLFNYEKSREYLKILRSQMSNDEQLMLYYNYIVGYGKDWENEGFLSKYRMLHNLPINKVKYTEKPRIHFRRFIESLKPGEGDLFEWGDTN